ncbi:outer membrane lipoprotein-sorting protein [Treponema medium]|uniref:outer membrane lipoprotein-sorting protein n=1 Tax=Treponema medium TaxID=58231 RepID=UPI001980CECC|nr:outer membrane lipoprotein-sorting protein [Treponema medium]QSH91434.1 outer membrane lipoprotein-sorting protein [Treponema medium]
MKKLPILYFLLICSAAVLFAEESAESIMKGVPSQITIETIGTRAKMEIQRNGMTMAELSVDQYSVQKENDHRTFLEIKSPANVKGTRFLMVAKDGVVDQRIYLPALGKVRRITGESEGTESFLGTDFSYNDMSYLQRDSSLDTYKILREEEYGGTLCYVIEGVPKNTKSEYSKTNVWVEKESRHSVKIAFYDRKNALVKIMEMSNYEVIQGVDTPRITKMTTLAMNTATIIHIIKMQYNMNIPDKIFTPRYLEQGR